MKKFNIIFDYQYCKSCELCVSFCPKKILAVNNKNINNSGYALIEVIDGEKCIGCCNCATICPDSVISIERLDNV